MGSEWRTAPRVCRCCLSEGCYKDISAEYYWMGEKEMYSEMLRECFDLTITLQESSSSSRLICEVCITRLRDAANFKKQVITSEKRFAEHLRTGTSLAAITVNERPPSVQEIKLETVKTEAVISDDDDDDPADPVDDYDDDPDYDESDSLPLKFEALKKETMVDISFGDEIPVLNNPEMTIKRVSSKTKEKSPSKKIKLSKKELTIKPVKASGSKTKVKAPKEPKVKAPKAAKTSKKGVLTPAGILAKDQKRDEKQDQAPKAILSNQIVVDLASPIRFENQSRRETMKLESLSRQKEREFAKPAQTDWKSRNLVTIVEFSRVYPFITSVGKYKCYVCSKDFSDPALLKEHTLGQHSVKEIIGPVFSRKSEPYIKVDVSSLDCKLCSENVTDLQALKEHLKGHGKPIDPEYKDNIVPFRLGGNSYDCQVCSSKFLDMKPLIQHMNKHFVNYSCEICGASFLTIRSLRIHGTSHETGSHKCDICNKVFSSMAKRSAHVRIVHEKKQIIRSCPKCPAKFRTQYSRVVHMVQEHAAPHPNFKCDSCERKFFLSTSLKLHFRRVHLNERTRECKVCGLRFINNSDVRKHMSSHSDEKSHRCDYCGKTYTRKDNLAFHMKRHRNELAVVDRNSYPWSGPPPPPQQMS